MNDLANPVLFRQGNWSLIENRGRQKIYRVLWEDAERFYVVKIGLVKDGKFTALPPPKRASYRETWTRQTVASHIQKGTLIHIDERGIPVQMTQVEIPRGSDNMLDKRRELAAYIDKEWGERVLTDKRCYAAALRAASNFFEVSILTARRQYEKHLFYGKHPNALLTHDWNKGAPNVPRRGLRDENGKYVKVLGRPTDAERNNPNTAAKRRRLTQQMYTEFRNFLVKQAWETEDTYPQIYEKFKESRYGFNRDETTGNVVVFAATPENLPSDEYLKRVGRRLFKEARLAREEARRQADLAAKDAKKAKKRRKLSGGSAQDLVQDQLSVLDIDATLADNQILFGDSVIEIDGQGKPTVLLAVDRGSAAVVGWYVSFSPESGDSYLSCVFSAFTPKERELLRWNVPHLKGMVFGCASSIFIDRGPGISAKAQQAIVERLRTHSLFAAPGDPAGKGHVEQGMRFFQEALSSLPGSTYSRGDADDDWQRHNEAKYKAVTLRTFMQALLTAISRRNMELDARHLLTPDMVKAGVMPCPADVYRYNKGRLRGDAAWVWSPETIFRRLCKSHPLKAPAGIVTLSNRKFSSEAMKCYARERQALTGKTAEVTVYEVPSAPFNLLWEDSGGTLGLLDATEQTKKVFEDGFTWSIGYQNRMKNALAAEAKLKARKNHARIIKQGAGRISKATDDKMEKVDQMAVPVRLDADHHPVSDSIPAARKRANKLLQRANLVSALSETKMEKSPDVVLEVPEPPALEAFFSMDDKQKLNLDF